MRSRIAEYTGHLCREHDDRQTRRVAAHHRIAEERRKEAEAQNVHSQLDYAHKKRDSRVHFQHQLHLWVVIDTRRRRWIGAR